MNTLARLLFVLFCLTNCQPKATVAEGSITETGAAPCDESTEPTGESTNPTTDSGTPDEHEVGPVGAWSTCNGRLTRDADRFIWDGNLFPCTIEGETSFEDGILTLHPDNYDECEILPWWFDIFESEHPSFAPIQNGTRLALLPTIPTDSARVLNLEETLVEEKWELVNQDGNTSAFKLCWTATGQFFEGRYLTTDESCSFLSCGGIITQLGNESDGEEHWSTQCAGNCPCGGVVTIQERTDTSLSGRYNAANCERIMNGTFTATPQTE